jgi:hypothetical protein
MKVQAEHKHKTRHMDDAIREAKSIYQVSVYLYVCIMRMYVSTCM